MRKARFLSSALDGQTVTLTATQGGVTVGPNTISAWKQPDNTWSGVGPATLTVTVDEVLPSGDQFAPLPVEWRIRVTGTSYSTPIYNAQPVGPPYDPITQAQEDQIRLGWEAHDPSYQRCQFVVHTGETGNYRNTWVGSPAHRDKAFQYGQNCGHVYSEPRTYTGRSIYVYDDEGNWGTLALPDLVVANPDAVFDAVSTIVVSPTSDWTGAPAHHVTNRCTSMDAASARFQKIKGGVTAGVRICVQSGASFNERARMFRSQDAKGACLVDTYGGSERFSYSERNQDVAVAKVGGKDGYLFEVGGRGWGWRIKGGTFDFGYDVANGRPTNASGWVTDTPLSRGFLDFDQPALIYNAGSGNGDPAAKVVFDNVDVTGVGWFVVNCKVNTNIRARATALFLNDCEFFDNADYTIINVQNLFSLGTVVKTSENTDLGGMGRSRAFGTSRGWRGHPIFLREQMAWTVYVRACYLECRGGWSGIGYTGYRGGQQLARLRNLSESSVSVQPAGWVHGRGSRKFFCDSVLMNYFNIDAPGDTIANGGEPAGGAHGVVENCLLTFDPQSGARQMLSSFQARASVRNCVFLVLDTPPQDFSNTPNRDATRFETSNNKAGRFSQFITLSDNTFKTGNRFENRHNTFVMLRAEADLDEGTFFVRRENYNDTFADENYEIAEGHNVVYAPNVTPPQGPPTDTINLPAGMRVLNAWAKWIWERAGITLVSPVADGAETPVIPYPVDWYRNATTGADYTGSAGNNAFTRDPEGSNETHYYQPPSDYPNSGGVQADGSNADQITIIHDCNAAGVVQGDGTGTHFKVLNRSGETWVPDTYAVVLDRGSTAMAAETLVNVDQSEFKLYRPVTPQPLDAGLGSLLFDFNRDLRPNAGYAISPSGGENAAGALLPGI